MSDHDDEQWDDKKDLTRLEDLSEFLHIDDPDVEEALKQASDWNDKGESEEMNSSEDFSFESDDDGNEDKGQGQAEDQNDYQDEASKVVDLNDLDDNEFPSLPSSENQNENPNPEDEGDVFGPSDDFSFESTEDFDGLDNGDDKNEDEDDEEDFGFNSQNEDEVKTDPAFDTSDFENSSFSDTDTDEDEFDTEEPLFASGIEDDDNKEEKEEEEEINELPDKDSSFDNLAPEDNYSEPEPQENNSPVIDSTSTPSSSPDRENFQDLRDFGNAISYGMVQTGGNPPYTLILRNVKYREDAQDIIILLREHGLVTEENETLTEQGLHHGHLLISQISEYSAIYLAHRMRRFDVQIRIGLSEQLHHSKSYTQENKGLVSKYNLRQDRRESVEMQKNMVDIDDIIMATTSGLEGYDILQYIKVLSAHHLISELELQLLHEKSQKKDLNNDEDTPQYAYQKQEKEKNDEDEDVPMQRYGLGLEDIYSELAEELRNLAFKNDANAVLSLNYSISPIVMPNLGNDQREMHYKITCTGNAVWISDRP